MKECNFLKYFLFLNPIFWGLGFGFFAGSTPVFAATCRSEHTIAGIDFGDCQSTGSFGLSNAELAEYQLREAKRMDGAIVAYNHNFATTIAPLRSQQTLTAWHLNSGEIKLYSLQLAGTNSMAYRN